MEIPKRNNDEVLKLIQDFKRIDFKNVDINEIKFKISKILNGYFTVAVRFTKGFNLYRSVKWDKKPKNFKQCSYPPPEYAKQGRTNREGFSVFYGSTNWEPTLFESRAQSSDKIAISKWENTDELLLNPIGFDEEYSGMLGSDNKISLEKVENVYPLLQDDFNKNIKKFLTELFTIEYPNSNSQIIYKITVALSEHFLFLNSPFDGIIYPSLNSGLKTYNVSLKSNVFDRKYIFSNVGYFEVVNKENDHFDIQLSEVANSTDKNGNLFWQKGRFESKSDFVKVINQS